MIIVVCAVIAARARWDVNYVPQPPQQKHQPDTRYAHIWHEERQNQYLNINLCLLLIWIMFITYIDLCLLGLSIDLFILYQLNVFTFYSMVFDQIKSCISNEILLHKIFSTSTNIGNTQDA